MKYYCYRHIRLDKNEPFYIGIATKGKSFKSFEIEYARAYRRTLGRNRHWNNIINMTDYEIEILFESDDINLIQQKEIEFIKLYGRQDLNTGTLVNLTSGGELNDGRIVSEETKNKMRKPKKNNTNSMKGKKWDEIFGKKISDEMKLNMSTKVITDDKKKLRLKTLFENKTNRHTEETRNKIRLSNSGKVISSEQKLKISLATKGKPRATPIKQFSIDDEFISDFVSLRQAELITGISFTSIKSSIKQNRSIDGVYKWVKQILN